jgi:protein required for attachment to host cells
LRFRKAFFSEEKKQKTFANEVCHQLAKVLCFFLSRKKSFYQSPSVKSGRQTGFVKNVTEQHYSSYLAYRDLGGVGRFVPRDASRYFGLGVRKDFQCQPLGAERCTVRKRFFFAKKHSPFEPPDLAQFKALSCMAGWAVIFGGALRMPHSYKAWIVIADGEHARLVSAGGDRHFHTIETIKATGVHSHSGSHQNPHDAAKHHFAARLAARVDTLVASETFDDLFVVAPAGIMKDLRAFLGRQATARIKTALQKDLTRVPDGDLPGHFPDWPLVLAA